MALKAPICLQAWKTNSWDYMQFTFVFSVRKFTNLPLKNAKILLNLFVLYILQQASYEPTTSAIDVTKYPNEKFTGLRFSQMIIPPICKLKGKMTHILFYLCCSGEGVQTQFADYRTSEYKADCKNVWSPLAISWTRWVYLASYNHHTWPSTKSRGGKN